MDQPAAAENAAVIDYASAMQVKQVPVGKFPRRSRLDTVPASVIGLLNH